MQAVLYQMEIGPMQNFQYFIGCPQTKHVAVVDPAWHVDKLLQSAERLKYTITKILLTHGHPDHCDGAAELAEKLNIPVLISQDEASFYVPDSPNLEAVKNNQKICIGNIEIECISTPGHTPGCMCFKCGDILLTGDTLFVNGCGRTDLPGGDPEVLYHSLYNVILKLPESTIIYPGHKYGPSDHAALAQQKDTNPFLTCKNKEEFLKSRMGY